MNPYLIKPNFDLRAFLSTPEGRKSFHASLDRYLTAGLYKKDEASGLIMPVRPPLFNHKQGFYGQGQTEGYISAAIAPGDQAGAAVGITPTVWFQPLVKADFQWMNLYTRRPSTLAGETYEFASAVFAYKELPLGEEPELATIKDEANYTKNVKYGAAVSIFNDWINDNVVWTINELLNRAMNDGYTKQSELAYAPFLVTDRFTKVNELTWRDTLNSAYAALDAYGVWDTGIRPVVLCSRADAPIFLQVKHDQNSYLLTANQLAFDFDVISCRPMAGNNPRLVVPGLGLYWQDREPLHQREAPDFWQDARATRFDFRGNFVCLEDAKRAAYVQAVEMYLKSGT